jgi:hypothetical protein
MKALSGPLRGNRTTMNFVQKRKLFPLHTHINEAQFQGAKVASPVAREEKI